MAAIGWTPQGRILCKNFGMTKRDYLDKTGHEIYEIDMTKRSNWNGKNRNKIFKWWYSMK